jgi:hypothetical protein
LFACVCESGRDSSPAGERHAHTVGISCSSRAVHAEVDADEEQHLTVAYDANEHTDSDSAGVRTDEK